MNKTDWTRWSAIAEILSAIAIVATLLYLAVQTQYLAEQNEQNSELLLQNNDLLRAQIHQSRSDSYEAFIVANADSEFFLPAWEKFQDAGGSDNVESLDALSPMERARVARYLQGRLGGYDNLYFQFSNGYLDPEFYETRVVESVRSYVAIYEELGLLRPGLVTQSFLEEIERIRASD